MNKYDANKEVERISSSLSGDAKQHVQAVVDFCDALGGAATSIVAPEDNTNTGFARVVCHIPDGVTATMLRLTDKVELLTDKGHVALRLNGKPALVVFEDFNPSKSLPKLSYVYLDREGVNVIEGEFPVRGFSASVDKTGHYVNMALGV
jgi:hypothetical protein